MNDINEILKKYLSKLDNLLGFDEINSFLAIDLSGKFIPHLNLEIIDCIENSLLLLDKNQEELENIKESLEYYRKNIKAGIRLDMLLLNDKKYLKFVEIIKNLKEQFLKMKEQKVNSVQEQIKRISDSFDKKSLIEIDDILSIISALKVEKNDIFKLFKIVLQQNLSVSKTNPDILTSKSSIKVLENQEVGDEQESILQEIDEIEDRLEEKGTRLKVDDNDIKLGKNIRYLATSSAEIRNQIYKLSSEDIKMRYGLLVDTDIPALTKQYIKYMLDKDLDSGSKIEMMFPEAIKNYTVSMHTESMDEYKELFIEEYEDIKNKCDQLLKTLIVLQEELQKSLVQEKPKEKKALVVLTKKAYKRFDKEISPANDNFFNNESKFVDFFNDMEMREKIDDFRPGSCYKVEGKIGPYRLREYKITQNPTGGVYRAIFFEVGSSRVVMDLSFKKSNEEFQTDLDNLLESVARSKVEIDTILKDIENGNFSEYQERISTIREKLETILREKYNHTSELKGCDGGEFDEPIGMDSGRSLS